VALRYVAAFGLDAGECLPDITGSILTAHRHSHVIRHLGMAVAVRALEGQRSCACGQSRMFNGSSVLSNGTGALCT
jgi:hypothetical protein